MQLHQGCFLEATQLLDGSSFENALLYIAEYNDKGASAFVVNKPTGRYLNELEEFKAGIRFPLYEGGPVGHEKIYFLHSRADLVSDGLLSKGNVYIGGNFETVQMLLNDHIIGTNDIKLFIGYCGWDAGQLEEEIEEGSWVLKEPGTRDIFRAY